MQVFFDGSCGNLMVGDQNYTFKQMHWHSPSEHRIDGIQYAAEGHLVHQADSGSLAVVSILYKLGHADAFINKVATLTSHHISIPPIKVLTISWSEFNQEKAINS